MKCLLGPRSPLSLLGPLSLSSAFLAGCSLLSEPASLSNAQPKLSTLHISEPRLHSHIKELASDSFEGRAPGTRAGEEAANWIAATMKDIGLKPAVGQSWFQPVSMVGQTLDTEQSFVALGTKTKQNTYRSGRDVVFWTTRQNKTPIQVDLSEMVFVGYGIVAPEYGWNDYEGLDVQGKTVVMLVNDPGYASGDPALFKGRAMTYYGRWTYKFSEAARQGATAALVIHETGPASYPWSVVAGSWSGEQADLDYLDKGADRVAIEGWLRKSLAKRLFAEAGLDLESMKQAAGQPGFKAVPMTNMALSGKVVRRLRKAQSRNVAGMITGSTHPDEYVLYVAHWDHLGRKTKAGNDGDDIFNGAVDNATGVAVMLEIAQAFAHGPKPERSVLFLAVTLEESGLLGSAYFAQSPFIPLANIVAGMNMDGILPTGPTHDMIVVGSGASELEDLLAGLLSKRGRHITPDPDPEAGYFYRSDHISLARHGVPMLYAEGGQDLVDGGIEAGKQIAEEYRLRYYHQPSDEYDPGWNLQGMVDDARILFQLGQHVANSEDWPNWYPGNEFRAIRDASRWQAEDGKKRKSRR